MVLVSVHQVSVMRFVLRGSTPHPLELFFVLRNYFPNLNKYEP